MEEIKEETRIKIVFDPIAHACGYGIHLGENHEVLPDGDWILWCKRISGIDDIFLYRHKESENFVLAKWIYNPEKDGVGVLMELEVFESPPNWRPPDPQMIRRRLTPSADMVDNMKKGIRDRHKAKYQTLSDDQERKQEVAGWLDRKGNSTAAAMVRKRKYVGKETPEQESFKQDLKNAAKGRIVTGGK